MIVGAYSMLSCYQKTLSCHLLYTEIIANIYQRLVSFFLLEISGQCRSLLFNSNWTDPIYDNLKNLTGEALLSLLYEMSPKPSEIFSHVMFVGQFIDLNKDVDMIMTDMGMCVFIFFTFYYHIYSCFFTIDDKI